MKAYKVFLFIRNEGGTTTDLGYTVSFDKAKRIATDYVRSSISRNPNLAWIKGHGKTSLPCEYSCKDTSYVLIKEIEVEE